MTVFEYLIPEELVYSVQFVSKHWREVSRKEEIWEDLLVHQRWTTSHFVYELVNMPAIDRYVANVNLMRNPRCLFSSFSGSNRLYSVDQDCSVIVNLGFNPATGSWIFAPNDSLIVTGCGTDCREVYEVRLDRLQADPLPKLNSPHKDHALLFWRSGLLISGGTDSTICEHLRGESWFLISPLPETRSKHSMLSVGPKVYCIGGELTSIVVLTNDKWETMPFRLPYEVCFPSLKTVQGTVMVIGGASLDNKHRKFILEIDLEAEKVVETGVVLYVITRANSVSRQGEYLMFFDYSGHVKKLRRPTGGPFAIPHSQFLHLFTEAQTLDITAPPANCEELEAPVENLSYTSEPYNENHSFD